MIFHRLAPALMSVSALISLPTTSFGEVAFPNARNAVDAGEFYLLEQFDDWKTECLRDEDGEDTCEAAHTISAMNESLVLDFSVRANGVALDYAQVDADVAPQGGVKIVPYSTAPHYDEYSAAISALDGDAFDGYWCPLNESESCLRGPWLTGPELNQLLAARRATITIYSRKSTPDEYEAMDEITVDLGDLDTAFGRANSFNAEIFGIDLEREKTPVEMCDMYLNGQQKRISFTYDETFDADQVTLREIVRGPKSGGSCPSYVALAYLTPDMTPAQREMFCIVYDKEAETISGFQQGERDAYRVCKEPSRSLCERVNSSKDAALAITGFASGTVASATGATAVTGTTVVMHSSGAAILTGTSGYVAGTLGTLGTTALGVLTAPLAAAAAAVSVVAVGGAVYVCS